MAEAENTVRSAQGRFLVPRVAGREQPCAQVENSQPHRDEHVGRVMLAKPEVYIRQDLGGREARDCIFHHDKRHLKRKSPVKEPADVHYEKCTQHTEHMPPR